MFLKFRKYEMHVPGEILGTEVDGMIRLAKTRNVSIDCEEAYRVLREISGIAANIDAYDDYLEDFDGDQKLAVEALQAEFDSTLKSMLHDIATHCGNCGHPKQGTPEARKSKYGPCECVVSD